MSVIKCAYFYYATIAFSLTQLEVVYMLMNWQLYYVPICTLLWADFSFTDETRSSHGRNGKDSLESVQMTGMRKVHLQYAELQEDPYLWMM